MFNINMNSKVLEKDFNTLNTKYNMIINNIVSTFPRQPITDKTFQVNIMQLQKIQKELFITKSVVDKHNENITQDIKKINSNISSLVTENDELVKKLNNLETSDNAAEGVLSDTVNLYDRRLLFNKCLVSITIAIAAGYYFTSIYKKP
jgi:cysteinyl-tRNA synthetase